MSEQAPEKNTTGEIDPSKWDEAVAVTGRPNDVPEDNSTFGSRKAGRADAVKVDEPAKATSRKRKS